MKGAKFMRDVADTYNSKIDRILEGMEYHILRESQIGKYSTRMPYPSSDFTDEVVSTLEKNGYKVHMHKDKSKYVEVSW